ncbi:hypothetical protein Mapa_012903 [Marchantia paleacea]|nr:hypothetical protein Mapa_012903 [Marchantia paleacea]
MAASPSPRTHKRLEAFLGFTSSISVRVSIDVLHPAPGVRDISPFDRSAWPSCTRASMSLVLRGFARKYSQTSFP